MEFVIDPPVSTKIRRMKERVRWDHPLLMERGIDQTHLVVDDERSQDEEFSFLVIGDSGSGRYRSDSPQRRVAEAMLPHQPDSRFVLHTGDVVYLVGSREQYPENFIEPYREWLVGGDRPRQIAYDQMVFQQPFFPVLGNHDYYDLPGVYGLLSQFTRPLRYLLRSRLDLDVGWHGSFEGEAFAKAFIDYLQCLNEEHLPDYLNRHYTGKFGDRTCLRYQPGEFTRIPNRYYAFRYGGIDFFALDSNTFNQPQPLPNNPEGDEIRRQLKGQYQALEQQQMNLLKEAAIVNQNTPEALERGDDIYAKLEQTKEQLIDIRKQLAVSDENITVDEEQLDWLEHGLIHSWRDPAARGRVLVFHHPPYVTEASKWNQGQTLAIRNNLRRVLNHVQREVGDQTQGRSLVDLVLNGHAHCLECLRTEDTGHADSHINWIVCGGSGFSLRRQRLEGAKLMENQGNMAGDRLVAHSQLFVGRSGQGSQKRRPYSFVRIDVGSGTPPKLVVRPYVVELFQHEWLNHSLDPLILTPV